MPIISNGQLLGEYYKELDGGSSRRAFNLGKCNKSFCRKREENFSVYKWKNRRIGTEICIDHGNLKNKIDKGQEEPVDLYFLASCGVSLSRLRIPLKDKGFALCSNGEEQSKIEVLKKDNSYKTLREKEDRHVSTYKHLHVYDLDI